MAGFASRWWSRLTHPYTRMGLRAGRTVALGAGIFGAGYSSGVKASLEDPERVQREVLASVLRQQGGSGDILAPDSRDARLVTRLGVQLIHAAEGHVAEQLEAAGEDEALRDGLETKLRALHNLPWKFVVIDSAAVNAFVTEMLPGYVFVHKGLLDAFDRNEDQARVRVRVRVKVRFRVRFRVRDRVTGTARVRALARLRLGLWFGFGLGLGLRLGLGLGGRPTKALPSSSKPYP